MTITMLINGQKKTYTAYMKNGRKYMTAAALERYKADKAAAAAAVDSVTDWTMETARKRAAERAALAVLKTFANDVTPPAAGRGKNGAAVAAGTIEKTGRELTDTEKRAIVNKWINENGLAGDPLYFAVRAMATTARNMQKYGGELYYKNAGAAVEISRKYMADLRPCRTGRELIYTAADYTGRDFTPRRGTLPAAVKSAAMVARQSAGGMISTVEDALQSAALNLLESRAAVAAWHTICADTAAAPPWVLADPVEMMEVTTPARRDYASAFAAAPLTGHDWHTAKGHISAYLRYDGRREYGKNALESLENEIERGRAKTAAALEYRTRVNDDYEDIGAAVAGRRKRAGDAVRYIAAAGNMADTVTAKIDIPAALAAMHRYTAGHGKAAAATLHGMIAGTTTVKTAAAAGVSRRTIARHKAAMLAILRENIMPAALTNDAPRRVNIRGIRIGTPVHRRGRLYFDCRPARLAFPPVSKAAAPCEHAAGRAVCMPPYIRRDHGRIRTVFVKPAGIIERTPAAEKLPFEWPRKPAATPAAAPARPAVWHETLLTGINRRFHCRRKSAADSAAVFVEYENCEKYAAMAVHEHIAGKVINTDILRMINHTWPVKMHSKYADFDRKCYAQDIRELWPPILPPASNK